MRADAQGKVPQLANIEIQTVEVRELAPYCLVEIDAVALLVG